MPGVTPAPEHDDYAPWGRSVTSWFVLVGVLGTVLVTLLAGPVAGSGTLALVAVAGGVLRLVLPRASGLSARSRTFDVTSLLSLGVLLAILTAIVPD